MSTAQAVPPGWRPLEPETDYIMDGGKVVTTHLARLTPWEVIRVAGDGVYAATTTGGNNGTNVYRAGDNPGRRGRVLPRLPLD